jgi:hypothetical protein
MAVRLRTHLGAIAGFIAAALAFTWPLARHATTHLTGPPSGDTGVYVWNNWVFRYELQQGRLPFFTSEIFALGPDQANLGLHNYTTFANVLAYPLIPLVGVVAAFNIVYLVNVVLTGYAMFLLARRVSGGTVEAWLAGVAFACGPVLVTRSMAHFSLVAAAPLPIFLLLLLRAADGAGITTAIALGATIAWAVSCDVYYGIYCLLLTALYLGWRVFGVERRVGTSPVAVRRALDVLILAAAGLAIGIAVRGGGGGEIAGLRFSMRTLYTPMLVLTILVVARTVIWLRPRITVRPPTINNVLRWSAGVALTAGLLLSPVLYALAMRIRDGRYVNPRVFWRSSPPGVDLLAFFVPNPNHPLASDAVRDWLAGTAGTYVESVASLSLAALAVVAFAVGPRRVRLPPFWLGLSVAFLLLSLGPFVRLGGVNTHVPGPWALLRYVPLVGSARSPSRFPVVVSIGVAVLFAVALRSLAVRSQRARLLHLAIGMALLFELWPAPRRLYAATIPTIYRTIAADTRDVRVLDLPTGIRDGTFSSGNFSALSQFYQTAHGKPLLGGYLSRVPPRRVRFNRRLPILDALYTLSEGTPLSPAQARAASARRDSFMEGARLGYVVIHNDRASPELRRFAIEMFGLIKVGEDGPAELFIPRPRVLDPPRPSFVG